MSGLSLRAEQVGGRRIILVSAWAAMLVASILPDVLWLELTGAVPPWLFGAKVALLLLALAAALVVPALRPLRAYALVMVALLVLGWGVGRVFETPRWTAWLAGLSPFLQEMVGVQVPRMVLALLMAGLLWLLTGSRSRFFLVVGRLDATAAPIPLITDNPKSWRVLGPALAAALTAGLVVFTLVFGGGFSLAALAGALPLLPLILLFAASNAFGEEMTYRASLLATVESPLGARQALLLTAAYFGILHYFGVPYGVLGVAMSTVVGWLLGKAMLETRGLFWSWFVHFCMDVAIFLFIAMGAVTAGG